MKESQIQTNILKWLSAKGFYAWRNNNGATYDRRLNKYRSNPYTRLGIGDILVILPGGQHCEIEVKTKTGKQSVGQVLHQKRVERLGGKYILARSIADVEKELSTVDNLST